MNDAARTKKALRGGRAFARGVFASRGVVRGWLEAEARNDATWCIVGAAGVRVAGVADKAEEVVLADTRRTQPPINGAGT